MRPDGQPSQVIEAAAPIIADSFDRASRLAQTETAALFRENARFRNFDAVDIYVADTLLHVVRKIAPDGTMTTVVGATNWYYAVLSIMLP